MTVQCIPTDWHNQIDIVMVIGGARPGTAKVTRPAHPSVTQQRSTHRARVDAGRSADTELKL